MKKIINLILVTICISFISVSNVEALECKYTIESTNAATNIKASYNVVCVPNKESKNVTCTVDNCKTELCSGGITCNPTSSGTCTYENVKFDLDFNDFSKMTYGCADYIYGIVSNSNAGTAYNGGTAKFDLLYILSESKRNNYKEFQYIVPSLLTNRAEIEKNYNNNDDDYNIKSDLDFEEGDCTTYLGDGSKGTPMYYLMFAFNLIKYAAIVLLLVLTIVEYVKAIPSQKDDAIKKASQITIKRLIIAIIIFFLPLLIEFILNVLGISGGTCGIK